MTAPAPLVDRFARAITYLRLSVTDRCDLRCTYCMPERMTFLPRAEVLSLEELYRLSRAFIERGVTKLRLTGGEPLVRRDMVDLVRALGRHLGEGGLRELTLTTNGTRLAEFAEDLALAGVRRINVSLDTLDRDRFAALARRDSLPQVLEGLEAARAAGLKVKLNAVALKGVNEGELPDLVAWAHGQGHDVTLIEVMPLGDVDGDRIDHYLPLDGKLALEKQRCAQRRRQPLDRAAHRIGRNGEIVAHCLFLRRSVEHRAKLRRAIQIQLALRIVGVRAEEHVLVHVRQPGVFRRLGERAIAHVHLHGRQRNAVILDDDHLESIR